tara:strand:- start:827 stop:1429 length:603 start_codon:yes stop_codon:yes gene_type:complete
MIKLNSTNKLLPNSSSIMVSYLRPVQISFGNYPYIEDLYNFITIIKNSLLDSEYCATNVLGGKTDWNLFNEHPLFIKFLTWFINKHQLTNPWLSFFKDRRQITNAWGNELKKDHSVKMHEHPEHHGILYLTKGAPLIVPELELEIHPEPGDYYFFPPLIKHYVDKIIEEGPARYNVIFNIAEKNDWEKNKTINEINGEIV